PGQSVHGCHRGHRGQQTAGCVGCHLCGGDRVLWAVGHEFQLHARAGLEIRLSAGHRSGRWRVRLPLLSLQTYRLVIAGYAMTNAIWLRVYVRGVIMSSATASATRMPSIAADMMPPA